MRDDLHTPSSAVGFLGKIPSQADFVRQHVGDRIGSELDQWLVKSVQNLQLSKAPWPAGPVRFVFSSAGCDSVAVGVMGKSVDQVGRNFPLAIYVALDQATAARCIAGLPLACGEFLSRAEEIIEQSPNLRLDELRTRVISLAPPTPASLDAATQRCREVLQQTPSAELFARLFAGHAPDAHLYGLFTLRTATAVVRQGPTQTAPTVLSCPISTDVDLMAWLDLTRRCLEWRQGCPSFAWVEDPDPRLMLALGFAADQLLLFVAAPKHTSARLWPLTTERTEAISRARDELGAMASRPGANVDEVWTAVAQGVR